MISQGSRRQTRAKKGRYEARAWPDSIHPRLTPCASFPEAGCCLSRGGSVRALEHPVKSSRFRCCDSRGWKAAASHWGGGTVFFCLQFGEIRTRFISMNLFPEAPVAPKRHARSHCSKKTFFSNTIFPGRPPEARNAII